MLWDTSSADAARTATTGAPNLSRASTRCPCVSASMIMRSGFCAAIASMFGEYAPPSSGRFSTSGGNVDDESLAMAMPPTMYRVSVAVGLMDTIRDGISGISTMRPIRSVTVMNGSGVAVGGTGVNVGVGGIGVAVGGIGVLVGSAVGVGGIGVSVGGIGVSVGSAVGVGGTGVSVSDIGVLAGICVGGAVVEVGVSAVCEHPANDSNAMNVAADSSINRFIVKNPPRFL